jgi:hypothetical protein
MPAVGILALLLASSPQIDVGVTTLVEVWDLNATRETLAGVIVGADHGVWRGVAIRGELLVLRVVQQPESAWLGGFTVGTRWRWQRDGTRPFIDIAVGLSTASGAVPPTGTHFNYLAAIGAGVERPLGSMTLAVTGRWLHASNNGRNGRSRNPDIQSLGALVSVGWKH